MPSVPTVMEWSSILAPFLVVVLVVVAVALIDRWRETPQGAPGSEPAPVLPRATDQVVRAGSSGKRRAA